MKIKLLLYILSLTQGLEIDFSHSRGLIIQNLTSDGVFINEEENREIFIKIPSPHFEEDWKFEENCAGISSDVIGTNRTAENLNLLSQHILSARVKEFFHAVPDGPPVEPDDDYLDHLPAKFFNVEKNLWRGIPKRVLSKDAIFPESIVSAGLMNLREDQSVASVLTDNSTNTFAKLDCKRLASHSISFIIPVSIQALVLVINNGDPENGILSPKIRLTYKQGKLEINHFDQKLCGPPRLIGSFRRVTAVVFWCGFLKVASPIEVKLTIDVNQEECERIRLCEIELLPARDNTNAWDAEVKQRSRRQFGEFLAAGALITGLSSWGSSWFHHSKEKAKIAKLEDEISIEKAHEANYNKLFGNEFQTHQFVNGITDKILKMTHNRECKYESANNQFRIESFINRVIDLYLQEIEAQLVHATVPIDGNAAQRTAISLCRSRNPNLSVHVCANFYNDKNNYNIGNLHFKTEDGKITGAVISVNLKIPVIATTELMTTHALDLVPLPLFKDKQGLYSFARYNDVPKIYGHFRLMDRKISLDSCKKHGSTFFCSVNVLNDLYSSESVCLNTLTLSKPSCSRHIIKSFASCVVNAQHGLVLVSHVGPIGVKQTASDFSNVQQFHDTGGTVKSSNVTLISGSSRVRIDCQKSSFTFESKTEAITRAIPIQNASQEFPMETNVITGLDAYKRSDEEYDHLIGQLDHLQDKEVQQALEYHKLQNQPEYHKVVKNDLAAVSLMEWLLPGVVAVVILVLAGVGIYCCCCNLNVRRLKNEYLCARNGVCNKSDILETVGPATVVQQSLRRRAPARPPLPESNPLKTTDF